MDAPTVFISAKGNAMFARQPSYDLSCARSVSSSSLSSDDEPGGGAKCEGTMWRVNNEQGFYWLTGDHLVASMTPERFMLYPAPQARVGTAALYAEIKRMPSLLEPLGTVTLDSFEVIARQVHPEQTSNLRGMFGGPAGRGSLADATAQLFLACGAAASTGMSMNTFLELYYPSLPRGLAAQTLDLMHYSWASAPRGLPATLRCAAYLDGLDAGGRREAIDALHAVSSPAKGDVLARLVTQLRAAGATMTLVGAIVTLVNERMASVDGSVEAALGRHAAPDELRRFFALVGEQRLASPLTAEVLRREAVRSLSDEGAQDVTDALGALVLGARAVAFDEVPGMTPEALAAVLAFDFEAPVVSAELMDRALSSIPDPGARDAFAAVLGSRPAYLAADRLRPIYRDLAGSTAAGLPRTSAIDFGRQLMERVGETFTVADLLLAAVHSVLTQKDGSPIELVRGLASPSVLDSVVAAAPASIFDLMHSADMQVRSAMCDVVFYETLQMSFTDGSGADRARKYAIFEELRGCAVPVALCPFESLLAADYILDVGGATALSSRFRTNTFVEFMEFACANKLHERLYPFLA